METRSVCHKKQIFQPFNSILMAILVVLMTGCGGGSGGDSTSTETGRFLYSGVVRGLAYETDTHSGQTDSEGRFFYESGEVIRFAIGDILLGQISGKAAVTPADLVQGAEDECHPTVLNLARFLHTLDRDGEPDNGIEISESVRLEATGRQIVFSQSTEDFETDEAVLAFLDTLNALGLFSDGEERDLCSADQAEARLRETLDAIGDDDTGGDGGGADSDGGDSGDSDGGDSGG